MQANNTKTYTFSLSIATLGWSIEIMISHCSLEFARHPGHVRMLNWWFTCKDYPLTFPQGTGNRNPSNVDPTSLETFFQIALNIKQDDVISIYISMMHVEMSRNKWFSNFVTSCKCCISSHGIVSSGWSVRIWSPRGISLLGGARIGWLDGTRWHMLGTNMRRSFYGYSTYIKTCHVTVYLHFIFIDIWEILAHSCISTNIQRTCTYISWAFFRKLSRRKPHQHFGLWKRKIMTQPYNILTCSKYPPWN